MMETLKMILKIALKIIKVFLLLLFILIGGIMIYFQIKVETYKNQLIELYDFDYLKRERKRYHPFVVFYLFQRTLLPLLRSFKIITIHQIRIIFYIR